MTYITAQDTMITDRARAALAAGWPRAAQEPDGMSDSTLPRTGAPPGEAQ
jgi:hypothetical protein